MGKPKASLKDTTHQPLSTTSRPCMRLSCCFVHQTSLILPTGSPKPSRTSTIPGRVISLLLTSGRTITRHQRETNNSRMRSSRSWTRWPRSARPLRSFGGTYVCLCRTGGSSLTGAPCRTHLGLFRVFVCVPLSPVASGWIRQKKLLQTFCACENLI